MAYPKKLTTIDAFVLSTERNSLVEMRNALNERISSIDQQLKTIATSGLAPIHSRDNAVPAEPASAPKKRHMSADVRQRIGAATRKRWAEFRKQQAQQQADQEQATAARSKARSKSRSKSRKASQRAASAAAPLINRLEPDPGFDDITA